MNFLHGLTLVFVILKLTGYINWSWWLVLLPLYGVAAIFLILAFLSLIVKAFK